MEFLVTMTTNVPLGTPEADVDAVRAREADRSRELAAQGSLLRLWRPPLRPGEWRSLGLFAAPDEPALQEVLASMPLRVWRTDEVALLRIHPNDPARRHNSRGPVFAGSEFMTTFALVIPPGAAEETIADTQERQARRDGQLAGEGHLSRLWELVTPGYSLGLWRATDPAQMEGIVAALPLTQAGWLSSQTTPLTPHPSDPGAGS
jgi:muconolactone delta-isomerase